MRFVIKEATSGIKILRFCKRVAAIASNGAWNNVFGTMERKKEHALYNYKEYSDAFFWFKTFRIVLEETCT